MKCKLEVTVKITALEQDLNNYKVQLAHDRSKQEAKLNEIANKVLYLEQENRDLKLQLNKSQYKNTSGPLPNANNNEKCKKIVIYGLQDYEENENDLIYRLIRLFIEIPNIDLTGFIEQATWIGKKGYKRPLMMELISKRMTKYILLHSHCFKNTGISISEFLDTEDLQKRSNMINILKVERKRGKHAIIRNNKLYIDGKEYKQHTTEDNKLQKMTPLTPPKSSPASQNLVESAQPSQQVNRDKTAPKKSSSTSIPVAYQTSTALHKITPPLTVPKMAVEHRTPDASNKKSPPSSYSGDRPTVPILPETRSRASRYTTYPRGTISTRSNSKSQPNPNQPFHT